MNPVELKIKVIDNNEFFKLPEQAYDKGSAAFDCYASSIKFESGQACYGFNFSVEFPENYVLLLFPRSSIYKQDLRLSNAVGVIDSNYRGELMAKFDIIPNHREDDIVLKAYKIGDAVCQMLLIEKPNVQLTLCKNDEQLSTTTRGSGGFGSSDSIFGTAGEIRI